MANDQTIQTSAEKNHQKNHQQSDFIRLMETVYACRPQARDMKDKNEFACAFINAAATYQAELRGFVSSELLNPQPAAHLQEYQQLRREHDKQRQNKTTSPSPSRDLVQAEFAIASTHPKINPLLNDMVWKGIIFIEDVEKDQKQHLSL